MKSEAGPADPDGRHAAGVGRYRLLPVLLALVVALSFQGSRGICDPTEGRCAECAREMLERDAYLEPTVAYRPHWSKPPLTYWSMAFSMRLVGRNGWGVRLPGALAFTLTVAVVTAIARRLWGAKTH